MKPYRLVAFDLDGTLYRGEKPVPHAIEAVRRCRDRGLVRFVTNNSGLTRAAIAEKLERLGFDAEPEEVYGTAWLAGRWCQEQGVRTAFVIGERGLHESLHDAGIQTISDLEPRADVVVAGICRTFDYALLDRAMQHVLRGARLIGTNRDATYPIEDGRFQPGAGAIVSALEVCSGVAPVVLGKPQPTLIEALLLDAGVEPSEALVVGDRLDSDIVAGHAAGCDTLLVLTGVECEAPSGQAFAKDLSTL